MRRLLLRVRPDVIACAVMAGCVAISPPTTRASSDTARTRVRGLDRSRMLTASELKAIDRELPGKPLPEVIRLLGQPDQEISFGKRHLRLAYWLGPRGNLKIEFSDGLVSVIAHNEWQTSVQ